MGGVGHRVGVRRRVFRIGDNEVGTALTAAHGHAITSARYEAVAEYTGEPRRILFWKRTRRYRDPPYVLAACA